MTVYNERDFHEDDFLFAHESGKKIIDKSYKATSYLKDVWSNFKKNKGAIVGFIIIVIIILMAIIGPSMNEHTYKSIIHGHECLTPRVPFLEKLGIFDGSYHGQDYYATKGASDYYYWFGADTQDVISDKSLVGDKSFAGNCLQCCGY